jgi:hypothetical protein
MSFAPWSRPSRPRRRILRNPPVRVTTTAHARAWVARQCNRRSRRSAERTDVTQSQTISQDNFAVVLKAFEVAAFVGHDVYGLSSYSLICHPVTSSFSRPACENFSLLCRDIGRHRARPQAEAVRRGSKGQAQPSPKDHFLRRCEPARYPQTRLADSAGAFDRRQPLSQRRHRSSELCGGKRMKSRS